MIVLLILTEQYLLVYWEEEDGVSVVVEDQVDRVAPVGESCSVKCGKSAYPGKIAAVGKWAYTATFSLNQMLLFW